MDYSDCFDADETSYSSDEADDKVSLSLLRKGYAWLESERRGYSNGSNFDYLGFPKDNDRPKENPDAFVSWSEFAGYFKDSTIDVPDYWAGASLWVHNEEIKARLTGIGVELLVEAGCDADYWLDAGPQGRMHLFLEPRAGSQMDLIATRKCPRCEVTRRSLPITNSVHLVTFVEGYETPCECVTPHRDWPCW